MNFIYKIAETPLEFEQIHELNYRTFVEEIPQHEGNVSQRLVDKFHDENTYLICKKDNRVVGMIAIRSNRPFSLDGKIGEVEQHLPVKLKILWKLGFLQSKSVTEIAAHFLDLLRHSSVIA